MQTKYVFEKWKLKCKIFFLLGTFCPLGRFVPWDVLSLGTFCPWDLMSWDVLSWDVLSLGTFCLGTFCLCTEEGTVDRKVESEEERIDYRR